MIGLVILSCAALASAAPHVALAPAGAVLHGSSWGAVHSAPVLSHSIGIASAPVVATKSLGIAVQPVVAAAPAISVANVPAVATAITKNVHYANQPVVTGYTSTVIKPDLGSIATPLHTVTQQRVAAVGRPVQTIVPHVTQVQPEISVQKVAVDVPVKTPVVSEVEVRTPVVHTAPAVVHTSHAVHATPVVAARTINVAPAIATHSVVAPAIATHGVVATHGIVGSRAIATHGIATHGIATHGIATHGIATHGIATHGIATHGLATHGIVAQHGW